jgi:hypothetical protein
MARSSGFSRVGLARLRHVLAGHVERGEVPGIVTLLSCRGEVHVDTIGTTAVGGTAPMRRDTIFRIASMTKPIIAAATMILVEECRVRLDDPDRRVHRRLSRPLSALAITWGLSPNMVSVASLSLGLIGADRFAYGSAGAASVGVLLYFTSVVLAHSRRPCYSPTCAEVTKIDA